VGRVTSMHMASSHGFVRKSAKEASLISELYESRQDTKPPRPYASCKKFNLRSSNSVKLLVQNISKMKKPTILNNDTSTA